jgi:hypothetical protein
MPAMSTLTSLNDEWLHRPARVRLGPWARALGG